MTTMEQQQRDTMAKIRAHLALRLSGLNIEQATWLLRQYDAAQRRVRRLERTLADVTGAR